MTWTWIVLLQLLALLLLAGEVFLPTFGLLTLATLAASGGSLWLARGLGAWPWILAAVDLALFPSVAWLLLSRVGPGPLGLSASLASGAASPEQGLAGCRGTALTDLRPAGKARIGDRSLDVVSSGQFLSRGCAVVVIETRNNRIVVRAATPADT